MIRAVLRPKEKNTCSNAKSFIITNTSRGSLQKNTTAIEIKWNCSQLTFPKVIVNTEHLSTVNYTL